MSQQTQPSYKEIAIATGSLVPLRQALVQAGIGRSTFYRHTEIARTEHQGRIYVAPADLLGVKGKCRGAQR